MSARHQVRILRSLLLVAWLAAFPRAAAACPGCKEALLDPQQAAAQNRAARGYAASIMMMLALPPLLVGGVATIIVRASRRPR